MTDLKQMVSQHVKECAVIDKDLKEKKKQSAAFINQIFYNLKLIFPAWRQNFKTEREYEATKEMWLNTLIDERITTQEYINKALREAKLSCTPFFPSIGQFIKWAKNDAARVNEDAYKLFTYDLPRHTKAEYQEKAKRGMEKIKQALNIKRGLN